MATATWLSAIVGIVAIVVGVIAIVRTNQLAAQDATRQELDRRKRIKEFADASCDILDRLTDRLASTIVSAEQFRGSGLAGTPIQNPLATVLHVYEDTVEGLRMAVPFDAEMAISLSRARRAIASVLSYEPSMHMWTVDQLLTVLDGLKKQLQEQRDRLAWRGEVAIDPERAPFVADT